MTARYYDVIVLGMDLAPLLCAGLLAKRGFRVLVLGQGGPPPTYRAGPYTLPRAASVFDIGQSPIARRVLSELRVRQHARRMLEPLSLAYQLVLPEHRLDVSEGDGFSPAEIEREFPRVKRPIADFQTYIEDVHTELDRLIDHDLVWPPETFRERRELARATSGSSFDRAGRGQEPLAELPDEHPFRLGVHAVASFAGHIDPSQITPLQLARLCSSRQTAMRLSGGWESLRKLLVDKLKTYSGTIHRRDRLEAITVKRGTVRDVRIAGSGETIGCGSLVAGVELSTLLGLLRDREPFEELFERLGEPQVRYYRYTLNLVVQRKVIPAGMGRDVYFLSSVDPGRGPEDMLYVRRRWMDDERALLCVQALLPRAQVEDPGGGMHDVRDRIIDRMSDLVPFLRQHLLLVDSPHDGRPPSDEVETDRQPIESGPHTMPRLYNYPVTSALGMCGMPARTPIERVLLCNTQVVPGLGVEGELLAAWSAARVVSRTDRTRSWLSRGLWTKVEL